MSTTNTETRPRHHQVAAGTACSATGKDLRTLAEPLGSTDARRGTPAAQPCCDPSSPGGLIMPEDPVALPAAAPHSLDRTRVWWHWVGANAWAEALGLGVSGAAAVLVLPRADGTTAGVVGGALLVVLIAGLGEGGIVGVAQHRVLRAPLPGLRARRWIGATVVGALIAWTAGMLPSTLIDMAEVGNADASVPEPALWLQLSFAVALGSLAGPILGGAQAWVLRDHVRRAWRWLPANAAAWAVGMPLVFLVAGGIPPTWPPAAIAVVAIVTLGVVGATVGAIHGAVLVRMLADPPPATLPVLARVTDRHVGT
jgi:hypothetical protein